MDAHVFRTFRFALRLNAVEARGMMRELERQRLLYNAAHQERQDSWRWACGQAALLGMARPDRAALAAVDPATLDPRRRAAHAALSAWRAPDHLSQKASLALKAQRAALGEVVHDAAAVATRWTLDRLGKAWDGFFARCAKGERPGYPRFRAAGRWRTWGCSELADGALLRPTGKVIGSRALGFLSVPNLGRPLAVRMHRMLPKGAEVRSCSFSLDRASGRWTVSLACRVPVSHGCETDAQLADVAEDEVLGYDAGVAFQATDSEGRRYPNGRHGPRRAKATRRAARKLSRARRGSANRARAKARLARLRRREADGRSTASRTNAARLVTAALEGGCRAVAREDLDLRAMMRSAAGTADEPGTNVAAKRGLDRALADAALGAFARDVGGKAERAGLRVVKVDPRRTSMTCSGCGVVDERSLGERTYRCVSCGSMLDRDHNAAVNIRRRAVAALRAGAKKVKGPAARRGRRSCASEPRSAVPALGRDGAKPRRNRAGVSN